MILEITYTNYPQDNPEYVFTIGLGGEETVTNRFPSVYELLDENWQIDITFFEEVIDLGGGMTKDVNAPTTVIDATWDYGDTGSITKIIDNTGKQGKVRIVGTWTEMFTQRQFDFRMNDESLRIDADTSKIKNDYYAPYLYIPDFRRYLEATFTFKVKSIPYVGGIPTSETTTTITRMQTVLNNWEANRRRLLNYRDNPLRKEQLDANLYNAQANSPNTIVSDPDGVTTVSKLR